MESDAASIIGRLQSVIQIAQGGIDAYHQAQAANATVARINQQLAQPGVTLA